MRRTSSAKGQRAFPVRDYDCPRCELQNTTYSTTIHRIRPIPVSQRGDAMNAKAIVMTLALCFVGVSICFADDANMGTWKLDEAKSKLGTGAPKNSTVVYTAVDDNVKVTIDGTDADGKPTHNEWIGKFDGK